MLAWMTAYFFAPFSAVYYPLSALPEWGQSIAKMLPMTYLFEGMRTILIQGHFSWYLFTMSVVLNLAYLIPTMVLFKWLFDKSRSKGLARLE